MNSTGLKAKTHPPEYLLHKYWSRKPHNILRCYVKRFFNKGDFVADPFCGSGVFVAEAKKENIDVVGFDVNPIAYLVTDVTTNPPTLESFVKEAKKLISYTNNQYGYLYTVSENRSIRYMVHEINSQCARCGTIASVSQSKKKKRKYYCRQCESRLSFNFENMCGTKVTKVFDKENNQYTDPNILEDQKQKSEMFDPKGNFDKKLIPNRRILAFPGMTLSDLFTPRAYSVLSDLFTQAHTIDNNLTRKAILLLLTSCAAQCSKLVPFRNNLSTGGPAWTIPGFWIAPRHLETNPIIHLEARYKKFLKGLGNLNSAYQNGESKVTVRNVSAQKGLKNLSDESLDGIFFDPPYGDNVPYLEFSQMWNGFISNSEVNYEEETVVSDRTEFSSSWDKYASDMEHIFSLFHKKLKKNGQIIMTFNNLDPKAWKILFRCFSKFHFSCEEARYQVPAVVSSKAQKSSNTSYIGDFYCIIKIKPHQLLISNNIHALTEKLRIVLLSRGGKAPKNLIIRVAILTILNDKMNFDFIDKLQDAIMPIAIDEGEFYRLRDEVTDQNLIKEYSFEALLKNIAISELRGGKKRIEDFYQTILAKTEHLGNPPLSEVKFVLEGMVLFQKDYCYLQNMPRHTDQLSLPFSDAID